METPKKYVVRRCPSWVCQGARRRFYRVAEVHEENPHIDWRTMPIGPSSRDPLRGYPVRTEHPTAYCSNPDCRMVIFVGPNPDTEEARIRAENSQQERSWQTPSNFKFYPEIEDLIKDGGRKLEELGVEVSRVNPVLGGMLREMGKKASKGWKDDRPGDTP